MIGDTGADIHSSRGRIFSVAVVLVLGMLIGRLAQLQLVNASEYSGESRTNSMREKRVLAARGTLMDRNGVVLVDNQPAYAITLTPMYFDSTRTLALAEVLEMPLEVLEQRIAEARDFSTFLPSPILNGVTFDRLARMLERSDEFRGVSYHATQRRRYPSSVRASHALGYVREISSEDLAEFEDLGYRPGDRLGQRGIERIYEQELRGRIGSEFRMVNVHGQDVDAFRGGVEDIDPVPGSDLILTIDADMQALAESLFVGKRGAAVALDPNNGEILALVSKPDFSLDQFTRQISAEGWAALNASVEKPLFNRATMSGQMPGSTWKPLIGLIALQEGVITPDESFYCPGYHEMGRGNFFRCMHVHGSIAVVEAIQESCNTFFFEMMRRVDVNTFASYARSFGFGKRIDTDLTEQDPGLIPDSSWYNETYGRWTVGYQMNLGVGQGELKVTPIQLARYMATVANGGTSYVPHLIKAHVDPTTGEHVRPDIPPGETAGIRSDYVDLAREAMRRVMTAGTGVALQIPGIESGAKTGTAENSRGRDDSVFIMFAPFENPQIALAVAVENAGFGGSAAGPIASLMAEQYLTGEVTRPILVNRMLNLKSDPLPGTD
ncbi:MAG: penicillin-binding protein 2 [Rhodothermales bacterium]|nr:penicillin-binding protein 2 [Rhodothermales bacterium]MBO6778929.1 penicillin-binding protein 2 [Rhodothermales bacterium]